MNPAAQLLEQLDQLSLDDVKALPAEDQRRLHLLLDHWEQLTRPSPSSTPKPG